jgi:hypothetical protein
MGHETFKGYAKGQSGIMLVSKLFVPCLPEDIATTFRMFMGVCTIPESKNQVSVSGHILQDMSFDGLEAFIQANKKESGYFEPGTEEIEGTIGETETQEEITWPKDEGTTEDVGGGQEISESEESSGNDEGSIQGHEEIIEENVSAGAGGHNAKPKRSSTKRHGNKISGDSGDNNPKTGLESKTSELGDDGIRTPEIVYADFPGPINERITDSNSGHVEEAGGDDRANTEEEPELIDIAKALLIPYKMNYGGIFDEAKMQYYLDRMHITLKAEDYFDILMDMIKQIEGA